jgi:hypothetical protein
MAKLNLNDIINFQNTTIAVINGNSNSIEAAIENTLSRDGTAPNMMLADLDMNSHRILNLLDATTAQEPVTLSQLQSQIISVSFPATIIYVMDGGSSVLTPGVKGDLEIPFACIINQATMLADQTGSIAIDVWRAGYSSYPPTVANTIVGGNPPTIIADVKSKDTTLTGWSPAINAGDTLRFNINSVSSIKRVTLSLTVDRA